MSRKFMILTASILLISIIYLIYDFNSPIPPSAYEKYCEEKNILKIYNEKLFKPVPRGDGYHVSKIYISIMKDNYSYKVLKKSQYLYYHDTKVASLTHISAPKKTIWSYLSLSPENTELLCDEEARKFRVKLLKNYFR